MAGIGVFVLWLGYSLAYYGIDQIRGGNNGLLDLMVPSRAAKIDQGTSAPDSGGDQTLTPGATSISPSGTPGPGQDTTSSTPPPSNQPPSPNDILPGSTEPFLSGTPGGVTAHVA